MIKYTSDETPLLRYCINYCNNFYNVYNEINARVNVLLWYFNKGKREVCEKYNRETQNKQKLEKNS
jgi:hypothetical protein